MTNEPKENTELPPRPRRATGPRVLIVDDDPAFLEMAANALAAEGLSVALARTAGEALVRAVSDPPDLVLLDLVLHEAADGIDVLEALRAEPETARIPVFACTALGERDAARLLTRAGFDGLLAKPLDLRALARQLRATLAERE